MTTSHDFGPRLKARREHRGITLESISEATKIGMPLLEALERGHVEHWPKGIFRRAFFRDYATAIGAPVDDLLAEFLQLYPEDGRAGAEPRATGPLRMTLATVQSPVRMRVRRMLAAGADAAIVAVVGLIAAWSVGMDRAIAIAVAGLVYYPLTTGWLGRSLALSFLHDDRNAVRRGWRAAARGAEPARAMVTVATETPREEPRAAALQRDRRTGKDRRHAPRLIQQPEPVANVFAMRKPSSRVSSPVVH